MIWPSSHRRAAAASAVLLWIWTLFMWGATPLATAQPGIPAGAVRIMDGTHNQLATVDHTGRLLVSTGSTSGLTDHITSVTHISGAVMIRNTAGTVATLTGTALDVNCTGCAAASVVEVDHVSSVTHVSGRLILSSVAGTAVTLTGTALDVNCTGCAAASVVEVDHVSSVTHVTGTMRLSDIAGNVVGVTSNALNVSVGGGGLAVNQSGTWTVQAAHIANMPSVAQGGAWVVTAAHQGGEWNIRHVSAAVHVVSAGLWPANQAAAVRCVNTGGTAFESCGGGSDGLNVGQSGSWTVQAAHQAGTWNIGHISAVTHVFGFVRIVNSAGTNAAFQNSTSLAVSNVGGQSGAWTIQSAHILSGVPQSGSWTVQAAHQGGTWNIGHISAAIHLAGGVTDNANSALRVTGVTVFTVMGAIDHISSQVHVVTAAGKALHIQGLGVPGQSHGGVLTVQGITGMNPVVVSQSTQRWSVDHITSATHVSGRLILQSVAGTAVTLTGTALDVNCTGCAAATVVEVDHVSSITHVAGTVRLSDIAGNVVGVTSNALNVSVGGGGLAVNQSGSWTIQATHQAGEWNIRHVSGAVHVVSAGLWPANQAAAVRCVNTAGTAFEACGGATEGAGVSQSGSWTVQAAHQGGNWNIGHISSVSHVFGFVRIVNSAGTNAAFLNSTSLSVSNVGGQSGAWTVQAAHQGGEWNVRHVSGAIHIVSAGLWPANQAAAVRCVNTGGTAFESCGGGSDGQNVGQSGSWTIQAAHQGGAWTIGHITSVTHIFGSVRVLNSAGTVAAFLNSTSLSVTNVGGQSGSWTVQAAHQGGEWNVRHVGSVTHVAGTVTVRQGFTVADISCHETTAIHQTASSQVIHGTGGFRIGICGILLVSAHAQGLSITEGLGTTCRTGELPVLGSITTDTNRPENSVVVAASGGFSTVAPSPWLATKTASNNICVKQTGTGSVSGTITWRPVP